jgi:hypothetical protein
MKIVFTPDWFLQGDVLVEFFSFIILCLFFYFSIRNYKLCGRKGFLHLGVGFLLIALAELSTILTKLVLYFDLYAVRFTQNVGRAIVTSQVVSSVNIFYYMGFFIHSLLILLGLYVIYRINMEKATKKDIMIMVYFIVISAFFGCIFHYYLFYLTSLIFTVFIAENYYKIYKKNKTENTKVLINAFSILAISQVMFLFSKFGGFYVVFAQLLQLVSYIILLLLIIRIWEHGKKKKSS